ncbi:hypothetical protein [Aeromicrobium sp. 9AM]|uniref:hypothetical protein n=1 Tax=Aeromicrobium sp. 9AM TaxID=2653126 RepID=UPI0012F0622D|nr:hypothetical protein [Aeromicrobium sp. 9AM]VXB72449.1 hypothetical protein AERO9AM_20747 [Aeromicrobium sp. 9AM]
MEQTPDALARLAATLSAAQPSVVAQAMRASAAMFEEGVAPEPQEGQCWRLRWNDRVVLAVISRVHDDYLLVMPVDLSPDAADETALVVPGTSAGLADDVTVFAMLETGVGPWTLELLVADLVGSSGAAALRRWLKGSDSELPAGWRQGTPTQHDAHPRRANRHDISATICALGDADWLDSAWTRNPDTTSSVPSGITVEHLEAAWKVLGGPKQRSNSIVRGKVEPSPEERQKLADAGLSVASQAPQADVIHFLDMVEAKAPVVFISSKFGRDEGELRRDLAAMSIPVAARADVAAQKDRSAQVLLVEEELRRLVAQAQE